MKSERKKKEEKGENSKEGMLDGKKRKCFFFFFCQLKPGSDVHTVKVLKYLRIYAALLCALGLGLPQAGAKNKKGDRYYKEGLKAEQVKNYDVALNLFDRALQEDPKDPGYMLADQRVRHK